MTRINQVMNSRRTGAIVAALAAAGLLGSACSSETETPAETTLDTPTEDVAAGSDDALADGSDYVDGTYEAQGSYQSPGGQQTIGVTVTLADSEITDVELDTSQTTGTSLEFQEKFESGIADEVVGRSIDDLDVDKVAGSSLTSGGFNAAIEEIKSEAAA